MSDQQRTTDALKREMMILQESRVELEKHIEKLVKEREELNKKIEESKTMKSEEARVRLKSKFYSFPLTQPNLKKAPTQ